MDFITAVYSYLDECGRSTKDLFEVVAPSTFYKYRKREPSLDTLIKIANFLKVNIDYLYELSDTNDFVPYSLDQSGLYQRIESQLQDTKLSKREFCRRLNISKDNLNRWKRGTTPSVQMLIEIVKYLNISTDDLLKRED